jgi:hypothetical protein
MKITTSRFDSWDSFVADASVISYRGSWGGHSSGNKDFYGTSTFAEATKLAREGWHEGVERVGEIRATISSAIQSLISRRADSIGYDVFGEYVDVGLFLTGEPECFGVRVSEDSISKSVVRINVNIGVSGSVSHRAIFARGAAVIAAVDVIESTGRRVEVYGVDGSLKHGGNRLHEIQVLLKSASQPLDIDRLVFALCHPSTLRRFCFSVAEKFDVLASESRPHEVAVEDGISTRPGLRSHDFTTRELLEEIKWICGQAGIEIPQEEIDSLVAV